MSVEDGIGAVGTYYDAQYFRLQELLKVARSTVEDRIQDAGVYAHQITARLKSRELRSQGRQTVARRQPEV